MNNKFLAAAVTIGFFLGIPVCQSQTIYRYDVAKGSRTALAAGCNCDRLYAAFEAYKHSSKAPDIFFAMSTDGGATWSSPVDISNSGVSAHTDIAVETCGTVDVVWSQTTADLKNPDIFFVHSVDGGNTWTKAVNISNTPRASTEPALAVGPGDSIHVVWSETGAAEKKKDIYYACSIDGGKKWAKQAHSLAVDISNSPGVASEPTIAIGADGTVHVAWADTASGKTHPDIYYARKENNSWTAPIDISNSHLISSEPALVCDKGKSFLAWTDNSRKENAPDVWLSSISKSGKFTKPINASNTPGVSSQPTVAAEGGKLAIAWSDTSTGMKTPSIYGRASLDSGADFSSVMAFSDIHNMARHPRAIVSGGKMFVIWDETSGTESEIKIGSLELKGLATGPALQVDPTIHGVTGNLH